MSQQAAPELAQHFAHLDLNLHTSLKSPELGPILCIPVGSCEAMSVVRTAPCVENHHAQSKHKSGLVRGHAAFARGDESAFQGVHASATPATC